ncbi:lysylphosphatidylglycerol synthase domain-containing protein [Poriferisphaera sp. WC338]|uniref:lysylphosphatidylglycerol synthase domain-containing protein n=1 Tax=Poriferisphaera sp. WC338 TaxID=3425129 RepID=UPI003D81A6FA
MNEKTQSNTRAARKIAAYLIGILLMVSAVLFALRGVRLDVLREAGVWEMLGIAVGVLGNLFLTGWLFWVMTMSFAPQPPVQFWRMQQLIALSGLLNYVPVVRPGLWGRAVYLKTYHSLAVSKSVLILLLVMLVGAVTFGVLGLGLLAVQATASNMMMSVGGWITLAGLLLIMAGLTDRGLRLVVRLMPLRIVREVVVPQRWVNAWSWVLLKAVDLFTAAFRLWIAFAVIGESVSYEAAVVATCGSLMVKMIGLTPNGLGLSEWAVAGLTAAITPAGAAAGAAAALIDRAVEVLVMLPAGLGSGWLLKRHVVEMKNAVTDVSDTTP